jgi:hypothetical protein
MKPRLRMVPLSAILLLAPLAFSQEQSSPAATPAPDAAASEARRQGSVAMKPNAQSPNQSMSQAIAFERYKELAAQREARKSGQSSNADRSVESKPAVTDKVKDKKQ